MTPYEEVAEDFERLACRICDSNEPTQSEAISAWLDDVPKELHRFAFRLISIYKSRSRVIINTGQLFQGENRVADNRISVNTGGGDMTGSPTGHNAKVDAALIQNIKGNIGEAGNIDAKGQALFNNAVDEMSSQSWDDDLKAEMLSELEKVAKEAAKDSPNESILKKCWGGITTIGSSLPAVVELGKWLVDKFPGVFS